jgi:hypothetical protein
MMDRHGAIQLKIITKRRIGSKVIKETSVMISDINLTSDIIPTRDTNILDLYNIQLVWVSIQIGNLHHQDRHSILALQHRTRLLPFHIRVLLLNHWNLLTIFQHNDTNSTNWHPPFPSPSHEDSWVLSSSWSNLQDLPTPHRLRRSGSFSSIDFAPVRKFAGTTEVDAGDTGSIRSMRSIARTEASLMAVSAGAGRVNKLPQDLVPLGKAGMMAQLRPQNYGDVRYV